MARTLRNILIFFFAVALVFGTFFWTRGCGSVEPLQFNADSLPKNRRVLVGAILALKEGNLILHPGLATWRKMEDRTKNAEVQIVDLLSLRVSQALDTILDMEQVTSDELKEYISEALGKELAEIDLPKLRSGEMDLSLDVTGFVLSHRALMHNNAVSLMDSLLRTKELLEAESRGNY